MCPLNSNTTQITALTLTNIGCYQREDYIEPHDDKGFKDVVVGDRTVQCSRDIAVILYMSKDWTEADGGLLVDYGASPPSAIVPQFNTLVAFRVPRLHEVTPVLTDAKRRYSVFGWLLTEGELYPLRGGSRKKKKKNKSKKK
jgi:Rps23 Pro-64 3,4-dihydroxylase Tpa1-like proline 4-hydroxylase